MSFKLVWYVLFHDLLTCNMLISQVGLCVP